MKKYFILFISLFFAFSLFSQEICDNGIDDDGDGLIDLNDTVDCACSSTGGSVTVPSLIPNPSFEDYSCCPSSYSQLSCADTWVQATGATSDYINTCDFVMNAGTNAGLVPFPDGNGGVGSIYAEGWQEYVGACLSSPLVSGTQYNLVMNIASTPINDQGDVCNNGNIYYGPIDITIFGSTSCTNLPASGYGCPGSPWQIIGTQTYTPIDSWGTINFSFTPPVDINAVIIGSPCTLPATGYEYGGGSGSCYPYFYFDNLILNTSTSFSPVSVTQTGNLCSNDLLLTASATGSGTYQWFFEGVAIVGQTATTLNVSSVGYGVGTYQVMYTDAVGCSVSESIVVQDVVNITVDNTQNINCNGGSTGSISITASGGTIPYNYNWTGPGGFTSTSEDISGLIAGTYTLTVTDVNSCDDITTVTLTEPPPLLLSTTSIDETCQGLADGSIDLTITGGTLNYTINWSNSFSTEDISSLGVGTFTVTVTDANGCQETTQVTINSSPNPTPTIIGNDFCTGTNTVLSVTNTYSNYNWSTNDQTPTSSITTSGTYSVTIIDANGCEGYDDIVINTLPLPTPVIVGNAFCDGLTENIYTTNTYTGYQWNTSQSTAIITVNSGGTYTVTVTDANGCEGSSNITLNTFPLPTPDITGNDFCVGANSILNGGNYSSWNWSTNETTQQITITTSGTYTITVTDANGCEGTDDITINEVPNPTPVILGDLEICEGESTILNVGGPYSTYLWSTNQSSQNITITNTGTYSVTVNDVIGCEGSTSIDVVVYPNPTPNITGVLAICQGSSTTLDAGSGYNSYQWNTNETNQSISTGIAGQYAVTVTDANGCQGTAFTSLDVDNLAISANPLSTTICLGTDLNLSVTVLTGIPPYTYTWSNAFAGGANQTVSPTINSTYTVYVTDGMGCVSNTEIINIDIIPGVQLDVFTNKDTICPDDPLLITSLVQYGIPPYTIYDGNNNIVSLNYITYPEQSGEFIYTIIDACNSTDADTITINFYPIPNLSLQADIIQGCKPLEVHFLEENIQNNAGYLYIWGFDDNHDNNLSLTSSPIHIFETSGYYDISLQVTTSDGCEVSTIVYNMINVFPNPNAKFDVLPDVMTIINPIFDFNNYSENAFSYIWNFDDGDSSNIFEPSHTYQNIGEYLVELIAISDHGCKDTAEHIVRVKDIFTLYVPTAFSPDNDGINDFFFVKGTGIDTDNFNLIVYDRWGEIIWQTDDYFAKWDGRAKGGDEFVEVGTYTWMVTCKDFEGNEHQKAGTVTVVR